MSINNTFFCGQIRKILCGYPSYLELFRITIKTHLGQAKAGLNSGVVLFSSGLHGRILLHSPPDQGLAYVCFNLHRTR